MNKWFLLATILVLMASLVGPAVVSAQPEVFEEGANKNLDLSASGVSGIIHVDASATGANNGTSWADAYTSLQTALGSAVSGDQIWVASGTYAPTLRTDLADPRSVAFQMKNGVGIYGGFPNAGTPAWADRDWESNVTILSGDVGILGNDSDNAYHVFYHPDGLNLDNTAVLDGFTISEGNANGSVQPHQRGGGMQNDESSPSLVNCTLSDNSAYLTGGGMWNISSSPTVTTCTFERNAAGYGAAIYNFISAPMLTGCAIIENTANSQGGGMLNANSSPTLVNCSFAGNEALGYHGGGLYNQESSSPTLVNCIFWGNSASRGAGIFTDNSTATVIDCTFVGNNASISGGGMENWNASSSVTNSIFWGNVPDGIYNGSSTPVVAYCDVQLDLGVYPGTGNINEDPLFVNAASGDFHLQWPSPCIDSGTNSAANLPATDFEGDSRILDGDGDGTATVDMGADEYIYEGAIFVKINEFLSYPTSGDWVELYNLSDVAVSLDGWTLSDSTSAFKTLSNVDAIPAHGWLQVSATNRLNRTGDDIILKDGTGIEIDRVTYGGTGNAPVPGSGQSAGRCPDGSDTDSDNADFVIFDTPTPGVANHCCDAPSIFYRDADSDGFGSVSSGTVAACNAPSGYVDSSTDCNDGDAAIKPGATEVCDGKDNDCDGSVPVIESDSDSDGTLDCNDGCPNDPNKVAPATCGCGIVDADSDLDSVANCVDNCPLVANPGQEDLDGDGVGDVCDTGGGGETVGDSICYDVTYGGATETRYYNGTGSETVTFEDLESLLGMAFADVACLKVDAQFMSPAAPFRVAVIVIPADATMLQLTDWRSTANGSLQQEFMSVDISTMSLGVVDITRWFLWDTAADFSPGGGTYFGYPTAVGQAGPMVQMNVAVIPIIPDPVLWGEYYNVAVTGTEEVNGASCLKVEYTLTGNDMDPSNPRIGTVVITEWYPVPDDPRNPVLAPIKRVDNMTFEGTENQIRCFTPPPFEPPVVATLDAISVSVGSATLNGALADLGTAEIVDVWFEYGTTASYGESTTPQSMTSADDFSADVSGLDADTLYHFRAVADGDGDPVYGDDKTFTTDPDGCGGTGDMDSDSDGASDCVDNCPDTSNPGQDDADGDGIGDECDRCPSDPSNQCGGGSIPSMTGWGAMAAIALLGALAVGMLRKKKVCAGR